MKIDTFEKAEELEGIKEEMLALLSRAKELVRGTGEEDAAQCWISNIRTCIDNDHFHLGGCQITIQDTIRALESEEDEFAEAA